MNRKSNDHAIAAYLDHHGVVLFEKTAPGPIRMGKRVTLFIDRRMVSQMIGSQVSRLGQSEFFCGRMRPALETGCRLKS